MDRAYSVLETKSVAEEDGFVVIRGIASTPSTDRMGDIVEPLGAKFKTPMPLLWQHQHDQPVGNVVFASPTAKGIPFEAKLPIIQEAGRLKDRVDEAIHSLKYQLVAAVSIGFKAIEGQVERLKSGGLRFKEWEWYELSLVTIPANSQAVITAVKSIDHGHLASAGRAGDRVAKPAAKAVALTSTAKRGNITITKR
jgi:HK97 family phage prohead protease